MKKIMLFFLFATILFMSAFTLISSETGEKEERNITGFSEIDMAIEGRLYYTQDQTYKVIIDASQDDLEIIETEVNNGILKIKAKNCWTCNFKDVNIYVSSPDMNGLRISGSGSIYAENDIQTDDLELKISGSGKINLKGLQANKVYAAISGSGDVKIDDGGNTKDFEAKISGSGSIGAGNMQANNVDARISGSGSCTVHAVDMITAKISGSGNIYYHGRPRMDIASSGSGKVKAL